MEQSRQSYPTFNRSGCLSDNLKCTLSNVVASWIEPTLNSKKIWVIVFFLSATIASGLYFKNPPSDEKPIPEIINTEGKNASNENTDENIKFDFPFDRISISKKLDLYISEKGGLSVIQLEHSYFDKATERTIFIIPINSIKSITTKNGFYPYSELIFELKNQKLNHSITIDSDFNESLFVSFVEFKIKNYNNAIKLIQKKSYFPVASNTAMAILGLTFLYLLITKPFDYLRKEVLFKFIILTIFVFLLIGFLSKFEIL